MINDDKMYTIIYDIYDICHIIVNDYNVTWSNNVINGILKVSDSCVYLSKSEFRIKNFYIYANVVNAH